MSYDDDDHIISATEEIHGLDNKHHEVKLTLAVRTWFESRPYGMGSAQEPMSEVREGSERFQLDGEDVPERSIQNLLGELASEQLIIRMTAAAC